MALSGVSTRALQAAIGTQFCGWTLYKAGLSRQRAARVAEVIDSADLAALAASEVFWDEVASIDRAGEEEVMT